VEACHPQVEGLLTMFVSQTVLLFLSSCMLKLPAHALMLGNDEGRSGGDGRS
jgi:hypothetical protein